MAAVISFISARAHRQPQGPAHLPRTSGQDRTLHGEIAPDAHPPPAPKRPEPPAHLRLLLLAGLEPALGRPGFGVREDVRAAVERVGLGADADAGG